LGENIDKKTKPVTRNAVAKPPYYIISFMRGWMTRKFSTLPHRRERTDMQHSANTIEDMKKLLVGYRDNMKVKIGTGVPVSAKTVTDLRALQTWPDGLVLDIHVRP
jgi:hypothetical protein